MGSSTTTTQQNKPYSAARPLLNQGLQDAQSLYDSGGFNISPYDGQMVAGYDPLRQATADQTPGFVQGGLNAVNQAYGTAQTAMDPSQWQAGLGQVRDNVIADIMPAINGSFAGSGMTGSSLHQQNLAKGLAAGVGNVYYDAYNNAQNRALSAAGLLPTIGGAGTGLLGFQSQVGLGRQQQGQAEIDAAMQRDQQMKTGELAALQDYLNIASGVGSTFGTQSATSSRQPGLLEILGLGLQSAAIF